MYVDKIGDTAQELKKTDKQLMSEIKDEIGCQRYIPIKKRPNTAMR